MHADILHLTAEAAWSRREEVGEIYRSAFDCSKGEAASFVSRSFEHIRDYPGATLLLATADSTPIGILYGYTYQPNQWWAQHVGNSIIEAGFRRYLDDAFSLVELAVLPEYQDQGIGTALIAHQMQHQVQQYTLLSTEASAENRAIGFYRRHGFEIIVSFFRYSENSPAAHIMAARAKVNSTKC